MPELTDAEFAAAYPMHMKAEKVKVERQAIGEFIEHGGYTLCEEVDGHDHPQPIYLSINQVLAKYFEIDMKLLEAEKRAMLKALTEQPI
jgi:hypothetical protein